jgi:hypothetical protein
MYRLRRTCTTTDNHPPASEGAAISGHRGQAREGGNAPAIQVAESGKSPMSAHDVTGPTPGTERSSSSASRHMGSRSASKRSRASSRQAM